MNKVLLLAITLFFISCSNNVKSTKNATVDKVDTIRKLNDVKLSLLNEPYEKAELLLGNPDVRGQIKMGYFYYTIYYNKINDNGQLKHLVLFVDGKNGINNNSPIYKIVAVSDGERIEKAGNFAQWLQVSKGNITSNSMDFKYGSGKNSWIDVEMLAGRKIKSTGGVYGDTKMVNSLSGLPTPKEAINNTEIRKYIVTGLTAREVYIWYSKNYNAVLQSNAPSEHKYLYMPLYSKNDNCALLTMTGSIDGSIKLEFSNQCGGD